MSLKEKLKTSLQLDKKQLQLEYAFEWDVNLEQRTITIHEEISEGDFAWFDAAMTEMERENRKSITIKINTYGGDSYESFAIVGRIRESNCRIITEAYGKVMSAGLLILASGKLRRISKYATAMHHACSYETPFDKHHEKKNMVAQTEKEEERRFKMFEEFTQVSWTTWYNMAESKADKYLSAEECLELNLVDEVF